MLLASRAGTWEERCSGPPSVRRANGRVGSAASCLAHHETFDAVGLDDGLEFINKAVMEVLLEISGKLCKEVASDLQVVPLRVPSPGGIHAQNQDRPGLIG